MEQRFRSKVDAWLVVPAALGVAVPGGVAAARIVAGDAQTLTSLALIALSLALASMFVVSYTVTADAIIVQRGPIRSRMPLERLRELRATRASNSAPALSLDRIEIRTDRGLWLLVSPSDRAGFVQAVLRRAPAVKVEGL